MVDLKRHQEIRETAADILDAISDIVDRADETTMRTAMLIASAEVVMAYSLENGQPSMSHEKAVEQVAKMANLWSLELKQPQGTA